MSFNLESKPFHEVLQNNAKVAELKVSGIGVAVLRMSGEVYAVVPGRPADRAGIKIGERIENHHDLRGTPGTIVLVLVNSSGTRRKVEVTREEYTVHWNKKTNEVSYS